MDIIHIVGARSRAESFAGRDIRVLESVLFYELNKIRWSIPPKAPLKSE
jgi:hypothetical protein